MRSVSNFSLNYTPARSWTGLSLFNWSIFTHLSTLREPVDGGESPAHMGPLILGKRSVQRLHLTCKYLKLEVIINLLESFYKKPWPITCISISQKSG